MWSLLMAVALVAAAPDSEVQTLTGDVFRGRIEQLAPQGVTLWTGDGKKSVRGDDLMAVHFHGQPDPGDAPAQAWIELVDGAGIVASEYTVKDHRATVVMPSGRKIEVPTQDIRCVRFQKQGASDEIEAEWRRILGLSHNRDVFVVQKPGTIDYVGGTIGDVTSETIRFDLDGEVLPVRREKAFGMIYYHPAGRDLPKPVCSVADASGSTWPARTIELDGELLKWETPTGVANAVPVGRVGRIDFSGGKIVYLSDMDAESTKWTPYFGPPSVSPVLAAYYAPRKDRPLIPGDLMVGDKVYAKGLAVHSRTELVYRLPDRFRQFEAVVGIDPRVREQGNVRLVITGDGRVLLETTVAGKDPPKPVDLDIQGVRRLGILVDFGEDLDVGDHLNLCNARIIK